MNTKAIDVIEHSAYPVIDYNVTEATLTALREQFGSIKEITAENYDDVKAGVQKMTKLRTGIEAHRNMLLEDARAFTANVNDEAKRVTKLVAEIEDPVKQLKTDHDAKVKAAGDAEKAKERARTDAINAKIDLIEQRGRELDDYDAAELAIQKAAMEDDVPTEEVFQEFHAVAMERHESTLARITVAHLRTLARELESMKLKEAQEKLAKDQAEADAKKAAEEAELQKARDKLAKDQAAFEAKKQADADAEAQRMADQRKKESEDAQALRDAEIAKQAAADALEAAAEATRQAEADEIERQALAPAREKLHRFANMIEATAEAAPVLENDKAQKLLARAVKSLTDLSTNLAEWADKL